MAKQQVKKRKFYKVGETVLLKQLVREGDKQFYKATDIGAKVLDLDIKPKSEENPDGTYKAQIQISFDNGLITRWVNLWEITNKPKKKKSPKGKRPQPQQRGLDYAYNQVRQFHKAFGHPVAYIPTFMNAERAVSRVHWMNEEIEEFFDAPTVVDQADAMIDLIYFALGTLVEIGVKPQRILDIVQNANMAKLHEDGKPRYREDGKIQKPEGWVAPESLIEAEIQRQQRQSQR